MQLIQKGVPRLTCIGLNVKTAFVAETYFLATFFLRNQKVHRVVDVVLNIVCDNCFSAAYGFLALICPASVLSCFKTKIM